MNWGNLCVDKHIKRILLRGKLDIWGLEKLDVTLVHRNQTLEMGVGEK